MATIRKAELEDASTVTGLALQLWPSHAFAELSVEFAGLLCQREAAVFLAFQENTPVGFAQCQLRHDYVEGTESSPVGYLEGIYVTEAFRKRGIARLLLAACEDWTRDQGCTEFASDCELENTQSLHFHLNVGFEEAGRIICFAKKLI